MKHIAVVDLPQRFRQGGLSRGAAPFQGDDERCSLRKLGVDGGEQGEHPGVIPVQYPVGRGVGGAEGTAVMLGGEALGAPGVYRGGKVLIGERELSLEIQRGSEPRFQVLFRAARLLGGKAEAAPERLASQSILQKPQVAADKIAVQGLDVRPGRGIFGAEGFQPAGLVRYQMAGAENALVQKFQKVPGRQRRITGALGQNMFFCSHATPSF